MCMEKGLCFGELSRPTHEKKSNSRGKFWRKLVEFSQADDESDRGAASSPMTLRFQHTSHDTIETPSTCVYYMEAMRAYAYKSEIFLQILSISE